MLLKDLKFLIESFNNQTRFYTINKEKFLWVYDSYSHELYLFDTSCIYSLSKMNLISIYRYIKKNKLIDISNILFQLTKIDICKKDSYLLKTSKKDIVFTMINTSHKCNLDCSYCYRDKTNNKSISIETIKKAIRFVMDKYNPNALGYVFTYSMTSESSQDITILEQILKEYSNFENRTFNENDLRKEISHKFYKQLLLDFNIKEESSNTVSIISKILIILNTALENTSLFEILNMSEDDFNENDLEDVKNRKSISKWKLFRINSIMIEKKYSMFIYQRSIPWLTFNFFTNGTCASKRFLELLKKINVTKMDISLDGPEEVHNYNRKFNNKIGSYKKIIENLDIFINQGIELSCSAVITPFFPNPLQIAIHAKNLGFKTISMVPIRYGSINSFDEETIYDLIKGYNVLFTELETQLLKSNYDLIKFLKDDFSLSVVLSFLQKTKRIQRCEIDNQLVIDVDGNIYQCLYNCSERKDCIGNLNTGIITSIEQSDLLVTSRKPCNNCWARYLCGGTCYYTSKKENSTYVMNNSIECILKKYLCKRSLEFIIFLRENGISSESFLEKVLSKEGI